MAIHSFLNMMQPVYGIEPSSTAAAQSTDWVSLVRYDAALFLAILDSDTADADVVLSLREATDASGTSAQAYTPRAWYRAQDDDLTAGTTFHEVTGATCTAEGSMEQLIKVEIDSSELSQGFTHVQLQHDDGGSSGKLIAVIPVAVGPDLASVPTAMPNAI